MIRSVALVQATAGVEGTGVEAAGRDLDGRLQLLQACVGAAPGPGLLLFPLEYFVLDTFAQLGLLRARLDDVLRSRHPTVVVGAAVRPDGDWLAPPPGPLGPADAEVDPWISSFALVRHRSKGWVWPAARQRALRPGQQIVLGAADDRAKPIDGECVSLRLGAEAVLLPPRDDATVRLHLTRDGCSCQGPFTFRDQREITVGAQLRATLERRSRRH